MKNNTSKKTRTTARVALPFDQGDKRYQQRARAALPLLVRQAQAHQTIVYEDLAKELGMRPRNLNYVLGSIGQALIELGERLGQEIPPIQCLVVNKRTSLPGEGVEHFINGSDSTGTPKQQDAAIQEQIKKVFAYTRWSQVLAEFLIQPAPEDFSQLVKQAVETRGRGGESDQHRKLKEYVAAHPEAIGYPEFSHGTMEYQLPSGDKLDVLFCQNNRWIAVEVKSHISSDGDLVRGVFQCVKYQAVLEALLRSTAQEGRVETLLVTTCPLPDQVHGLKEKLGVQACCIEYSMDS